MDSRTAQAQYEANPADAASLLAWKQAHQLLQQLNAAASQAAAVQAAVVWQHYGEQSTFWFYHLARERQAQTTITQLCTTAEHSITLDSLQSTHQAAQALQTYYSASTPEGLFAPPQTSLVAQDRLLAALDLHLSPGQQQQGEGAAGDGSISLEDLTKALGSLPRSKAPGFDGLPYEFYQRFWEQLGPERRVLSRKAVELLFKKDVANQFACAFNSNFELVVGGTPVQTGAPVGAKGGRRCRCDQLCSVELFRLFSVSNLLALIKSLCAHHD